MSGNLHARNPRYGGTGRRGGGKPSLTVKWHRYNDTWCHGEVTQANGLTVYPGGAQNTVPVTMKIANGRAMLRLWAHAPFAGGEVRVNGTVLDFAETAERHQAEVPLEVAMRWYANAQERP